MAWSWENDLKMALVKRTGPSLHGRQISKADLTE